MKKIILIIILAIMLTYVIPGVPSYTEEGIRLYVNGHHLSLDQEPVIIDGRTLVPVRRVLTAFGVDIQWDPSDRSVVATFPNTTMELGIDQSLATVNGQEHILEVPPTIIQDRTFVPVRFVAESLGARVTWDGNEQIVYIDSERINYHGEYKVKRVVDGDTIVVDYKGQEETLRLIGIDTPESVHPDQERNTTEGKEAARYTKEILGGRLVGIQLDVQERDQYGRLLAYVWLDGELYNKMVVEAGMATVATYPPNVKYEEILIKAQEEARMGKKGFWNSVF
ncbi:stalk domain-containing protein [Gudongella sp. SC589]|uniref:stalk domain-containing protein n=1 Tax=Gudongella sp. SC589 TaxID=3385990 RepID=UPI003904A507